MKKPARPRGRTRLERVAKDTADAFQARQTFSAGCGPTRRIPPRPKTNVEGSGVVYGPGQLHDPVVAFVGDIDIARAVPRRRLSGGSVTGGSMNAVPEAQAVCCWV